MKVFLKRNYIMFVFMILFCLSVVSSGNVEDISDYRVINMEDASGSDTYVPLKAGQKFIIEVYGNPTTGFHWYLDNKDTLISGELVTPLNLKEDNTTDFYTKHDSNNSQPRVGAGGLYHFKFQASQVKTGGEILQFSYRRSWESVDPVKKTIHIVVVSPHDKGEL